MIILQEAVVVAEVQVQQVVTPDLTAVLAVQDHHLVFQVLL
jgi:hypothetical protein